MREEDQLIIWDPISNTRNIIDIPGDFPFNFYNNKRIVFANRDELLFFDGFTFRKVTLPSTEHQYSHECFDNLFIRTSSNGNYEGNMLFERHGASMMVDFISSLDEIEMVILDDNFLYIGDRCFIHNNWGIRRMFVMGSRIIISNCQGLIYVLE